MDKKNTILGIIMLLGAFAAMFYNSKMTPPPVPAGAGPSPSAATAPAVESAGQATTAVPAAVVSGNFAALVKDDGSARVVTLANDFIEVRFTDFGGAIKEVAFKKHAAVKGRPELLVFNELHADPMLAFTQESFPGLDRSVRYEQVSRKENEIVFRAVFENRIEVLRRYSIEAAGGVAGKSDPYQIRHETIFRNLTGQTVALPRPALSIGTASLLGVRDTGQFLTVGYNDGKDSVFVPRGDLEGGGFLGFNAHGPVPFVEKAVSANWGSVTNQFFASILTPDETGVGVITRRIELPPLPGTEASIIGLTGAMRFEVKALAPAGETKLGMSLYVGPKEYKRLSNIDVFKRNEDAVMQFGVFRFFSRMLITMMTWIHGWAGNWGLAIILTTLLIKLVSLPLTLMSARSMKRMQKLAPEMKAINEKFKDNPQKRGEATMRLYKERGVNPMGGCIPMLIPLPFFMGFFSMLPSASELRFSDFLWVHDLAAPDTIAHIGFFPINPLPIILGITMIVQMRLVPQPSMDNEQAVMMSKMMKWMPLIYVVMAYNFSCALALYSTVNGLFTILQQLYINRIKDPEPAAVVVGGGGRGLKNVTPSKKKG